MKRHDTEFMSELHAARKLAPSWPVLLMFFSIIALILLAGVWANVAEVEKITRGEGQVVPTKEVKYIQSLEGGILEELLVAQGQQVKAGDVVIRINNIQFASEERGAEARSIALKAQKERLTAEIEGKPFTLSDEVKEQAPEVAKNELALFASRQQELKNSYRILDDRIAKAKADLQEVQAQINRLSQSKRSVNEELKITREMVRKRAMPKIEEIRLNRELSDMTGQINAYAQSKKALQASVKVTQTERASQDDTFRSQALKELSKVETDIAALTESLKTIGDRVDRADLRTPVDGIVNKISLNTIGGVIEPAMKLMEIVPVDDELKITAKIIPSDIGFIRAGQPVKVKVSAYDPQVYGSLDGVLERIGANATADQNGDVFFEVDIKTHKNYVGDETQKLPISPGMQATVEIITGKRTIMNYLLKPLFRAKERAFTER